MKRPRGAGILPAFVFKSGSVKAHEELIQSSDHRQRGDVCFNVLLVYTAENHVFKSPVKKEPKHFCLGNFC